MNPKYLGQYFMIRWQFWGSYQGKVLVRVDNLLSFSKPRLGNNKCLSWLSSTATLAHSSSLVGLCSNLTIFFSWKQDSMYRKCNEEQWKATELGNMHFNLLHNVILMLWIFWRQTGSEEAYIFSSCPASSELKENISSNSLHSCTVRLSNFGRLLTMIMENNFFNLLHLPISILYSVGK